MVGKNADIAGTQLDACTYRSLTSGYYTNIIYHGLPTPGPGINAGPLVMWYWVAVKHSLYKKKKKILFY